MMCYQDRTFCPFLCCAHEDCGRRLTQEIRDRAARAQMMISQFGEHPDCYTENTEKKDARTNSL
jgi:hypothetical protein